MLVAFVVILTLMVAAPPIITQESLPGPGFVSFDIETKTVRWLQYRAYYLCVAGLAHSFS